ncbi:sensor histidine kinase [Promicromonospora thailandica]|uniref:histidine kinase n=1 Tax=Promicromonospora thailandica TaxID=765201 RepID=A0A9X2G566_9MICO|nr:HAMP domain-containing sensor histidine kinase [Promicromonospora thailandica]MCP2262691.1 Signal transduction histidine kinase [Promicromonospora thailandica]
MTRTGPSPRRVRLPGWARTVRMRLALTYSATLFGVTALILAGVYLALSSTVVAAPLDPVTVKRFEKKPDGSIAYKPGEQFQAADLDTVQHAVNWTALQTLRDYSAVALGIMFLLSVVIGWWVAGRALRPVEAITRTAQEIGATDLSRRIGATGPHDELRTLADTIDGMLDRLDRAFSAERRLIEDVSHELRNPVMVVQANVEAVLADDQADRAQRAEATAVVLAATGRMSRLLEDLLATARLRSEAFTDREVDLAALAAAAARENRAVAGRRGVSITERAHPGPVAYGDANALARALDNLLSNAVRLAPAGSAVTVGVGSRQGWAWVAVADEGPGVPPEARDRIFDRFYRGPDGGADDRPGEAPDGTGLGLAIARQVAESHDGHLLHADHGDRGSTFTIWLPDRTLDRAGQRANLPPGGDPLAS